MYRYVLKRVKETYEFGCNVRKTFACQHNLNVNQSDEKKRKNQILTPQENISSLSKNFFHEEFRKRYNCKYPYNDSNSFLHALTWSTALIAGFYASQLICMYQKKHHFERKKCFYSKFLCSRNRQLHKKFLQVQECNNQNKLLHQHENLKNTEFLQNSSHVSVDTKKSDKLIKIINFLDVGVFKNKFLPYFDDDDLIKGNQKVYNVNDSKTKDSKKEKSKKTVLNENERYDKFLSNIDFMIGNLELEMGIQCIQCGNFEEAIYHFKISSNAKNPSGSYNLALLYEHGFGVKKDLQMAKRLYQFASDLGHAKALYNLGVFYAQGIGTKKNFYQAKSCFEKAANLGDASALKALSKLRSKGLITKLSPVSEEYIDYKSSDYILVSNQNV